MFGPDLQTPRWHTASAQGPRALNADAVGAFTDPATRRTVFALADGVGDEPAAARAARVAAAAAARSAAAEGPAAALLAAQRAVRELGESGDCVLVVAVPFADRTGYRIGWVGDARAYAWDGAALRQLTTDHTLAQYFRVRHQPVTPRMEHMVTTSVRTAAEREFGITEVRGGGLVLTSDGVHKTLTAATMRDILADPARAASALVETAIALGGQDNATAMVIEPMPAPRDATTETFTAPTAA
ncbi:PP2C family protein-serine/threonine phosphatase [Amycolatopsis anabasis]|uniref:PP2C family protein-serine/threonine phosphatase n=1 Tax=Amycolatopsis anabasis TaxID=1840409 RepID=UPI00131CA16F|nr:serine/threonine protein phosphatase [Amycolatopsis anabasis]